MRYADPTGNEKDVLGQEPSFADKFEKHYQEELAFNKEHGLTTYYDTPEAQAQNARIAANQPQAPHAEVPDVDRPSIADGLVDGSHMEVDDILDLATDFLGEGYTEPKPGSGRFVSRDQLRVFRMGENDILGKHGGGRHVNFETLAPNPAKPGKMQVVQNIHIYFEE